jgi:TonB-dependent SusC/RagA subfamily outer membrane receptor
MKQNKPLLRSFRTSFQFLTLFLIAMLFSGNIFAQGNRTISGIVQDENGDPLPGASVVAKKLKPTDSMQAVATDVHGHFSLTFPKDIKELVVTYVGYKTKTVALTSKNIYQIQMESESQAIDEVVVTGAFTRKANSFTGAVSTVKGDDLLRMGNQNALQSLKNIDPSFMQIENLSAGSNPNALPDFQMRGSSTVSSIQGEYSSSANQPLFILDGFETELTKIIDLDMNQIESMTILKDATAKAIYGSKAANGVIVIETKRPASGKMRITYNGNLNIEAPDLSSYKLCNAAQKLEVERMAGLFTSSNAVSQISLDQTYTNKLHEILAGVNTDWMAQPIHTGVGQKHAVYMEGGDASMLYGVDLSYNSIKGVMKGSDRNTFSGGMTLTYRVKNLIFRDKLTIDYNDANDSPWGTFSQYCQMNPYEPHTR